MTRKFVLMLALSVTLASMLFPAAACTIFNAAGNGMLLAGNNEEHEDPNGEVRFEPASEGKYGKITFAFGPFTQGGMNVQGLFFDCWAPNAFKMSPWLPGQILPNGKVPDLQPTMDEMWQICSQYDVTSKQMLETCATVEEAIVFYRDHYEASFGYAHMMVTDKAGNSATFTWDWDQNKMSVTHKSGSFQVIGVGRNYIFPRLSRDSFEVSVDSFRELLMSTTMDSTAYSNIYDLKQGAVYVYVKRDFENVIRFDLNEELAKGNHSFFLKDLIAAAIKQ